MDEPKPVMAQKSPYGVELKPGRYAWCRCGRSNKQPFCDGSHRGTGFSPVLFEVTEPKTYWLCGCKHTKGQPFCDGTHKTL
ncbi:MAG: CDGSH iron-sulfur domain-containing protein [Nitrospirae bacterium]|nr:CDGSH iron-sulfur domain-containing protein [Nitrospirota bacterium]